MVNVRPYGGFRPGVRYIRGRGRKREWKPKGVVRGASNKVDKDEVPTVDISKVGMEPPLLYQEITKDGIHGMKIITMETPRLYDDGKIEVKYMDSTIEISTSDWRRMIPIDDNYKELKWSYNNKVLEIWLLGLEKKMKKNV